MASKNESYAFGTDFHGHEANFEKLLRFAQEAQVDHLLIGGDLAPGKNDPSPESVVKKRAFVETALREVGQLASTFRGTISLILGNNDLGVSDQLEAAHREGILKNASGRVVQLSPSTQVLGYSHVPPLKSSDVGQWYKPEEQIEADLLRLSQDLRKDVEHTIASVHAPPSNSPLSRVRFPSPSADLSDRGSKGVRRFFEALPARFDRTVTGLTGHIHRAWQYNAEISEQIGGALVINPGASEEESRILTGYLGYPNDFRMVTL